jgi:hypothetical protein
LLIFFLGSVTLDELMTRLIHVSEIFNQQLQGEIQEEVK